MYVDSLTREIHAYEGLLPSIVRDHGSGWALIAHEKFVRLFEDFAEAARYADQNLPGEQVLIRHTEAVQDSAPFLAVCR